MESNGPILLLVVLMSGLEGGAAMACKAEGKTCQALVGYVTQQATNLSAIASLFQLDDYRSLLGANAWELWLPASATLPAGYMVRVPILCACNSGTGVSAHRKPIYTVQEGEYLDMIARDIFAGLLPYEDIVKANGIPNPNQIAKGQKLYIPLPCSCSHTDKHASNNSFSVLHYTYIIQIGNTLDYIASSLQTSLTEIVALNDIFNASLITAGQVLDVPLKACSLGMSNSSPNNTLVVAKGNYAITANHCVQCSCGLEDLLLYCAPASLGKSCSNMHCKNSNLMIGNITKQETSHGCNITTCSYTGYDNHTIFTSLMSAIQPKCSGKHIPLILTKPASSTTNDIINATTNDYTITQIPITTNWRKSSYSIWINWKYSPSVHKHPNFGTLV